MYNVHLLRSGPVLAGQGQGQVVTGDQTGDQTSVHCRNIITRPQPTVMDQTGLDRILRVVGCVLSTPWLGLTDFFYVVGTLICLKLSIPIRSLEGIVISPMSRVSPDNTSRSSLNKLIFLVKSLMLRYFKKYKITSRNIL